MPRHEPDPKNKDRIRRAFLNRTLLPRPPEFPSAFIPQTQQLDTKDQCIHFWVLPPTAAPGDNNQNHRAKNIGICKFCGAHYRFSKSKISNERNK